jgi:hypothetical protein
MTDENQKPLAFKMEQGRRAMYRASKREALVTQIVHDLIFTPGLEIRIEDPELAKAVEKRVKDLKSISSVLF